MPAVVTALPDGGATQERLAALALVVSLGLGCAVYCRGVQELWRRRGPGAVVAVWRVVAFGLGVLTLGAALIGPVDEVADRSLTAHMAQHMLLMVVAAPLLAAGTPGLPMMLASPRPVRRWLARRRSGALVRRLRRPLVFGLLTGALQSLVLWAWHLPSLYVLAVDNEPVHFVEHATFIGAFAAFWAAVLGAPGRRLPPPVSVLVLFASMLPASALGAVLTLAAAPIYPARVLAPDGLYDQQLAGLVMWIPMDGVGMVAALAIFCRWMIQLDRSSPPGQDLRPADQTHTPMRRAVE